MVGMKGLMGMEWINRVLTRIELQQLRDSGGNATRTSPEGADSGSTTSRLSGNSRESSPSPKSSGTLNLIGERLRSGSILTRQEVADFLRLSSKTVQRLEASGRLRRCPGLGTVVRYAASDVLRLASAR